MTDDLIDRAEAQTAIQFAAKRYTVAHEAHGEGQVVWSDNLINVTDAMNVLRELPSVQPETNCSEIPNNSDTISRQQAIDVLRTCYDTETVTMDNGDEYINYEDAVGEIEQLPSAQPYTIHSDGRLWVTVDDIDKVNAVVVDESKSKFCKQFYMDAQPERKTGRWIHQAKFSRVECDQCGKVFRNSFAPKNFCPNCGADMRGEKE